MPDAVRRGSVAATVAALAGGRKASPREGASRSDPDAASTRGKDAAARDGEGDDERDGSSAPLAHDAKPAAADPPSARPSPAGAEPEVDEETDAEAEAEVEFEESETLLRLPDPLAASPMASAEYAVPPIPPPPGSHTSSSSSTPEASAAPAPIAAPRGRTSDRLPAGGLAAEPTSAGAPRARGLDDPSGDDDADVAADGEFPEPPTRSVPESDDGTPSEERELAREAEVVRARQRAADTPRHDILFGELARLEGFATSEQVNEALRIQERLEASNRRRKIGKIMVKLRFLTATQAKYVLRLQRQKDPIEGYKLLERRGQGGMGVVYRAVQKSLKREVAVKILSPRFAAERRFLQRFFQEAKLSAELNHQNVVSAIDFGESQGYYYYAMEYVDGWSVSEMLKEDGPFDSDEALDVVLQIARGLEHAAKKHIVHRDIKPENILVTPDGVAKLTDLGLSKQLTSDCSLTAEGKTLGTPFYVSPELARGVRNIDQRSDIYSLGATLYHMLAGDPPFTGDNAAAIMACHIAEEPPPLRRKAPHVSKIVQRLVERMMDKDPDQRYQSASDLARDVTAILKGKNPFAPPPSRGPAPEAPSGRLPAAKRPVTGPRRAYQEPRERRPAPAPRADGGGRTVLTVIGVLVGVVLFGLVTVRLMDPGGPRAARSAGQRPTEPSVDRERVAEGRLAAALTETSSLLDRGLYEDALRLAREVAQLAEGTAQQASAQDHLRSVEGRVLPAARIMLRRAEEALEQMKPELALEHLADVPPVDDPQIRSRVESLRQAARQLSAVR